MQKKIFMKSKGVTLIALVVTIIVLLVLAGISISMLTGQNGILSRTAETKEKTNGSQDLEYLKLKATEALMDYYQKNTTESEDEYILDKWDADKTNKIDVHTADKTITYNGKVYAISDIVGNESEKKKITENSLKQITVSNVENEEDKKILSNGKVRIIVEEENGMRAAIPNGFYYVIGKPSNGLVISDRYGDDDNNSKGGNQFVWIPCSEDTGATNSTTNGTAVTYEKANGLAETWKKYFKQEYNYTTIQQDPIKGTSIDDWEDKGGNLDSVKKYGGFYVARYEAGLPENSNLWAKKDGSIYGWIDGDRDTAELTPVSKKNNASWNMISQKNAVIVSEKMYEGSKTVISKLMDSYAWDTIISWYNKTGIDWTNSTSYGNYANTLIGKESENNKLSLKNVLYAVHYKNSITDEKNYATKYNLSSKDIEIEKDPDSLYEIATGSTEYTKKNNIYDLAGNMWEWTTEVSCWPNIAGKSEKAAVFRGGSFIHKGNYFGSSSRNGGYLTITPNVDVGFRTVLYIII